MSTIYVAAILTTFLALLILGSMIFWKASPAQRKFYLIAILLQLPMCAVMYYLIREPYLRKVWIFISSQLNPGLTFVSLKKNTSYFFLRAFEAPLAEDLAKLWPLLIPWFRKQIRRENAVKTAMALGLGFGVGELWFIAELLNRTSPNLIPANWYQFYLLGGYIGERLMVCFMHGAFVAVPLCQLHQGGKRFILGVLGMMSLHFIGNFPISLAGINLWNLGQQTWTAILTVWVNVYFLLMLALLIYLTYGKWGKSRSFLFGKMKCPECGEIYDRPVLGLNLMTRRYEKCSSCKKYHWVKGKDAIKPESNPE